jgi:aminoglycoside phosphotransferase (APT) family kinase protein
MDGHGIVPTYDTLEAYLEAIHRAEPWLPVAAEIGRRSDIDLSPDPELKTCCKTPVLAGSDHVVKLYFDWYEGHRLYEEELAAYRVLARKPDLPVPRVVAHGSLEGTADYLVMTQIAGQPLRDVIDRIDEASLVAIAAWAGRLLRDLHAVPLTDEEREAGMARFAHRTHAARITAVDRLAERPYLPAHLLGQVEDWLPPYRDLAGPVDRAVMLHGGFKLKHLFVKERGEGWVGSGVIDFNRIAIGDPMADLPWIWHEVRRWPPSAARAFVTEAELPGTGTPDFARHALAWSLTHRAWRAFTIDGLEDVASLDDLAVRVFVDPLGVLPGPGAPRVDR